LSQSVTRPAEIDGSVVAADPVEWPVVDTCTAEAVPLICATLVVAIPVFADETEDVADGTGDVAEEVPEILLEPAPGEGSASGSTSERSSLRQSAAPGEYGQLSGYT
jgi:hypothetical protein